MLLKKGVFNNIPEKLIPPMPPVGTLVEFELAEMANDPYPIGYKKGAQNRFYPRHSTIPVFSSFSYRTDTGSSEWVRLGMINGLDKNDEPIVALEMRQLLSWSPFANAGKFTIQIGSSPVKDNIYQYLMLASFVSGNMLKDDQRDQRDPILLRYIDKEQQAQSEILRRELKREALKVALNLTDDELHDIAQMLLVPAGLKPNQLRNEIESYAETKPTEFLARVKDDTTPLKARIAEALQLEIVTLDVEKTCLRWNDTAKKEIMKLAKIDPDSVQEEYARFVKEGGDKVDKVIAKEIKLKKGS